MAARIREHRFGTGRGGSRSVGQQPKPSRATYPTHPLLQLRETLGNQAYGRFIQAKLNTGEPVDPHEQVARQIADVTSMVFGAFLQPIK